MKVRSIIETEMLAIPGQARLHVVFPALFRDDLLIFKGERNMFPKSFVYLHPQNNKTKEIMPEISKFYRIIIYM